MTAGEGAASANAGSVSASTVAASLIKKKGIAGVYKGLGATMARLIYVLLLQMIYLYRIVLTV